MINKNRASMSPCNIPAKTSNGEVSPSEVSILKEVFM